MSGSPCAEFGNGSAILLPVSPTAFFWCLVFDGRSLRVKSDGATLNWRGQGMSGRALPDRRKGYSSVSNFPVPDEIGPLLAAYDHRSVGHQRGERVLFDAVPPSPVRNVAAAHRKSATGLVERHLIGRGRVKFYGQRCALRSTDRVSSIFDKLGLLCLNRIWRQFTSGLMRCHTI